MSAAYDAIAGLEISVESYELEKNDREYSPEFTRGSTIIHLKVVGRELSPLYFVCSTRLTTFGEESRSTTDAVVRRLEKYPTLRFKLDPENDWDEDLIGDLAEIANVDILDLKGLYRGTPVDVETDLVLYRNPAAAFPDAYLEVT